MTRLAFHFNSRPHGGRHGVVLMLAEDVDDFNSRPHGGRLYELHNWETVMEISTHALTEGDLQRREIILPLLNFNSRPHGGRPVSVTL